MPRNEQHPTLFRLNSNLVTYGLNAADGRWDRCTYVISVEMGALRREALSHFRIVVRYINLAQRIVGVTKHNNCQLTKPIFAFSYFCPAFRQVPRFGRFGFGRRGGRREQEGYVSFL